MLRDRLLAAALLLFIGSAFALPSQSAYALVFYAAVLPALAARAAWPPGGPPLWLALALIGFSGATLLWGTDDGHRSWRFAWDTVNTAAFVLAMATVLPDPRARARLATVLSAAGAANAVLSITLGWFQTQNGPRLHGWGATTHPILGADVVAVAALTALWRGLAGPRRLLHLAAFVPMAAFILLTESRGPLLAAGAGALFLCAAGAWRWRALAAFAAIAAAWWALPAGVQQHAAQVIVERGSSHRFEIWTYAARIAGERPLFGHGLADNLHLDVAGGTGVEHITFAHDLYLSLLFYSGVAGFGLFAALALWLTARLLRNRSNPEWPWLGALWLAALTAGLTDLGQVTKGPGPLWFILWLPIGLLLTQTRPSLKQK